MKRSILFLMPVLLAVPLISSIIDDLHITEDKANSIFVRSLGAGLLQSEYKIVQAARALPASTQAAGIKQLIRLAKDYSKTASFTKEYSQWRQERLGYRQKQRGLRVPSLGKLAENAIDKQLNKSEDEKKIPADPQEMIKKRLQEFLALSATVDFEARLNGTVFANPEYESKSDQWKMCYRAGKPVIDAAREEAEAWLKELQ